MSIFCVYTTQTVRSQNFMVFYLLQKNNALNNLGITNCILYEDFDIGVQRPQMTFNSLKKGLTIACNSVNHLFGVNHFMKRCLRFKHVMQAVMEPYKEVNKNMQKKAKQSQITSFSTKQCVLPPPCTLNHFITLTCVRKYNQCHSNKHKHKPFLVLSSLIYILPHFMYL